jgi:ribosomal protein S18 acetylase RimI-like enzyme
MIATGIAIRKYMPADQPWFERLNRAWIEQYFQMEPVDVMVLRDPEQFILDKGGKILMAVCDETVVGTVALKFVEDGVYEFTKMAVDDHYRGRGIGLALAEAALDVAHLLEAKRVILYSNTRLKPAIALYRKIGFKEVPVDAVYKRSDIKMELSL